MLDVLLEVQYSTGVLTICNFYSSEGILRVVKAVVTLSHFHEMFAFIVIVHSY